MYIQEEEEEEEYLHLFKMLSLPDTLLIQYSLERDVLSPLLSKIALEIAKEEESLVGMKLKGTDQLLVYTKMIIYFRIT
jgi:hypothetical protein